MCDRITAEAPRACRNARPSLQHGTTGPAELLNVELIKLDRGHSCGLSVTGFDACEVYRPILAKGTKT